MMRKFRIAHLIYSKEIGGSEMVAANVCGCLDRGIFDPYVLFMYRSSGSMPNILEEMQIPYKCLNLPWRTLPFERFYLSYYLNKLKVDILHVHHIPLLLKVSQAVRLSRIKGIVFTEHAKFSIERSKRLQNGCIQAAHQVDCFTTISDDLKAYFVNQLNISGHIIQVIQNGVDISRFKPENGRPLLKSLIPKDFKGKVLIHVGRLAAAKDHSALLQAFQLVIQNGHNVFLFLVGEGELRIDIEKKISELGLRNCVKLLGMRSDIDNLLPGADIFVISSKREGLPMVLLEAMACGMAVVATDVGGVSEVIKDHENGLLVEAESPECLARAIEEILVNPETGADLGNRARKSIAENYSLETAGNRYMQLYKKILFAY